MRQAMILTSGVPVSLGAWRHGVLRQAVTRKQWGFWENAGAWREVNTARRSGAISPGDVWVGPGGNAVVLAFDVLFC